MERIAPRFGSRVTRSSRPSIRSPSTRTTTPGISPSPRYSGATRAGSRSTSLRARRRERDVHRDRRSAAARRGGGPHPGRQRAARRHRRARRVPWIVRRAGVPRLDDRRDAGQPHDGRARCSRADAQFGDVRFEELLGHAVYANRRLALHGDRSRSTIRRCTCSCHCPIELALETDVRRLLEHEPLRGNVHADSVQFGALAAMYPSLQKPKGLLRGQRRYWWHARPSRAHRRETLLRDGEAGDPEGRMCGSSG